jgi:hypothetical protein
MEINNENVLDNINRYLVDHDLFDSPLKAAALIVYEKVLSVELQEALSAYYLDPEELTKILNVREVNNILEDIRVFRDGHCIGLKDSYTIYTTSNIECMAYEALPDEMEHIQSSLIDVDMQDLFHGLYEEIYKFTQDKLEDFDYWGDALAVYYSKEDSESVAIYRKN